MDLKDSQKRKKWQTMRSVNYYGYTIFEDGTVHGLYGKDVKKRLHNDRYEIKLSIEGKRKNFVLARLVYHAFHPFDIADKNLCISYKDGDKLNVSLDNLYLTDRKELIQGEKHRNRSKLSNTEVEEIRNLYNGKAGSNQRDKKGYSLQDLAIKYGVSKSNIMWIVKGMSRDKEEYKLK